MAEFLPTLCKVSLCFLISRGDTHLQVFVADLYDKLSADMALLKDIMRDMSFEMPSDCTFEDFDSKIRSDDRTRVIDDMNLRLAYQKVCGMACSSVWLKRACCA